MPLFNSQVVTNSGLNCIYPGDTFTLFNGETPQTGQSSIAVGVAENPARSTTSLAFDFFWATNPGAFNFQIQGSDDALVDSAYFTEGSGTVTVVTAQADGSFRARVELTPWVAKLVRVKVAAQSSNAVACTVKVTAI